MYSVQQFLYQIPGLIFVIKILIFLFVSASASASTYSLWPLVAALYLLQALSHYCMKPTLDTRMLNTLHSNQHHAATIYISVWVT